MDKFYHEHATLLLEYSNVYKCAKARQMCYGIFVSSMLPSMYILLKITDELMLIYFLIYQLFVIISQVPYYLAELTEKIAQDDRIQILKASQAKLKVRADL